VIWLLIVYPRAAAVALLSLLAFAVAILLLGDRPGLAVAVAGAVAVLGVVLTSRVAAWEARQRGGTGEEGSGPIEPLGPAGPPG
jgi:hypothetical protein